ncbi:MAG: hypothetical protein JXA69_12480 [Phycisphaerae bacterium]|nr:hypothetical protein [Phycisphaerae bacterium]
MRLQFHSLTASFVFAAVAGAGSGSGCGADRSCDVALRWRAETLRTVYSPPAGFYCYAPSVIRYGDTDYVFACRNAQSYVIRDHICAFRWDGGRVSEFAVMLGPNPADGAWDSFHVCDPSVVAGRFRDGRRLYRYAMFYLGNDVDASRNNQVGVAFSETLAGPWTRYGEPVVPDPQRGRWGTGQPSAISLDRDGHVLLFYTKGHGRAAGYVRELNLADLAHPVFGEETRLSTKGLTRTDGGPDVIANFDVALDRKRQRFVAVRERRPYPTGQPSFIGEQIQIVSLPAGELRESDAEWRVEGEVTPAMTGFARNHNAGIVRTPRGELPEDDRLTVFFASSETEPKLAGRFAAWTYALHEISAEWQ